LLSFPIVGFAMIGFAHASAAVLLVRLLDEERETDREKERQETSRKIERGAMDFGYEVKEE
jgi:hypothetical protein